MQLRHRHERGQTLPVWILAVITSLALMFFSLNYAYILHWQTRAQTAADAAASAALAFQKLDFNKMSVLLYTADVEEWRIRHLLQGMLDVAVDHPNGATSNGSGNGGCVYPGTTYLASTPSSSAPGGSCFWIYQNLYSQYLKAVARYTNDVEMIQATSTAMTTAQQSYDVQWNVASSGKGYGASPNCSIPVDCAFSYNLLDYSYRTTTQGVGRDAAYVQMGGFPPNNNVQPINVWEPARIEVAACKTVQPITTFNFFGLSLKPFVVIGRAAATNVPINEEWLEPGVDNSSVLGGVFQAAENYNNSSDPSYATQDTYASSQSPRPWYETSYQGSTYTAQPGTTSMPFKLNAFGDDFEALVSWWTSVPIAPYLTTSFTQSQLCTQEAGL